MTTEIKMNTINGKPLRTYIYKNGVENPDYPITTNSIKNADHILINDGKYAYFPFTEISKYRVYVKGVQKSTWTGVNGGHAIVISAKLETDPTKMLAILTSPMSEFRETRKEFCVSSQDMTMTTFMMYCNWCWFKIEEIWLEGVL